MPSEFPMPRCGLSHPNPQSPRDRMRHRPECAAKAISLARAVVAAAAAGLEGDLVRVVGVEAAMGPKAVPASDPQAPAPGEPGGRRTTAGPFTCWTPATLR